MLWSVYWVYFNLILCKDIGEVFESMREYEVVAKSKKCKFTKREVTYLRHRIDRYFIRKMKRG